MAKETICSLLAEAIKDEEGAPVLYDKLIRALKDPDERKRTQDIIEQERLHKVDFERMFKKNKCRTKGRKANKKTMKNGCIPAAMPL